MTTEAALELLGTGDPDGALILLGETASPDEVEPARHAARGMVLLANDRPAGALSALRIAVALGDSSPPTLLNLALAEQKAGSEERAVRLMCDLEQLLPLWDEPALRLAELLRAAGKVSEAELAYGRVLEINPRRESALLGLAGLLIMRGEGATARDLLLRSWALRRAAPKHGTPWASH